MYSLFWYLECNKSQRYSIALSRVGTLTGQWFWEGKKHKNIKMKCPAYMVTPYYNVLKWFCPSQDNAGATSNGIFFSFLLLSFWTLHFFHRMRLARALDSLHGLLWLKNITIPLQKFSPHYTILYEVEICHFIIHIISEIFVHQSWKEFLESMSK